jgi:hypothetical protein
MAPCPDGSARSRPVVSGVPGTNPWMSDDLSVPQNYRLLTEELLKFVTQTFAPSNAIS